MAYFWYNPGIWMLLSKTARYWLAHHSLHIFFLSLYVFAMRRPRSRTFQGLRVRTEQHATAYTLGTCQASNIWVLLWAARMESITTAAVPTPNSRTIPQSMGRHSKNYPNVARWGQEKWLVGQASLALFWGHWYNCGKLLCLGNINNL